jgi:large subunit ribosomal protein L35
VLEGSGYTATPVMPKMKSHSGAKKRFKVTGTGKVLARHSFSSHILEKKSPKRKRHMALPIVLVKGDASRAKTMLNGNGR